LFAKLLVCIFTVGVLKFARVVSATKKKITWRCRWHRSHDKI